MELQRNISKQTTGVDGKWSSMPIIHESEEMKSILDIVSRIAKSSINVIIAGESGTGKELIAREIHKKSNRSNKPFVTINCASFTEELFDSELFGHAKGSFTGAINDKSGYVTKANGGTIYLDEITTLTSSMQAKLLRFAQNGEYNRVGDSTVMRSDVRIISSTNRKLENEIKNNTIREDLFYRLNTIVLRIPPIRKRREDIPALVRYFLGSSVKDVTPEAMEIFTLYPWPGNIRELMNCIERIKILLPRETGGRRSIVTIDDIPAEIRKIAKSPDAANNSFPQKLDDVEREHILNSLQHFNGNKSKTSLALGITLKTLYNKLNKYENEGWI
ncbi:MAG: sigma-54 dependent transcriptional regulator [Pseudomonadota bacterium]